MENTLTYNDVRTRCNQLAMDIAPDLPKENTLPAWECFVDQLGDLRDDSFNLVLEAVEATDWAIYTHYGWKILHAVPQDCINDAESQFLEFNSGLTFDDSFDIWSLQSQVAFHVLVAMAQESLDEMLEELDELAQTRIDNLES